MEVPRAQLRVFSPLETFPERERERWRAYVEAGGGVTRRQQADLEADVARAGLLTGRPPLGSDAALVRRVGGRVMLCPLQLELRAARAFERFRRSVPAAAIGAFLPAVGSGAQGGAAGPTTSGPHVPAVPHILDEPWSVPLQWFVAFDPGERRFVDPAEGRGARIVHLTTCRLASDRLERVIRVVEERTEDGEDILVLLADLAAWVDAFDPASLLELDYAGVGWSMSRDELAGDHTCAELWRAVEALEQGDGLGVAAAFGVASSRWRRHRSRQDAS